MNFFFHLLKLLTSGSVFDLAEVVESLTELRSEAPEPIIDQYLVNDPHQFFKVYGIGDMYAPKNVSLQEDLRYQNVRIIVVYDTNQISALRS
jgi:hypothetical protein